VSEGYWSLADMPDLAGRRVLVTGVTSGLGTVAARELARAGAEVLLAARNGAKLEQTVDELAADVPRERLVPLQLDLADLASVRRGAAEAAERGPIDVLVNNAGVMATPKGTTTDGFELQLGTNHFGHFALTGLLLDALTSSGDARVVTVSSLMAQTVRRVSLEDPRHRTGRYWRWNVYGQSKLANLLFAFELDRRARAAGLPLTSVAAHPGWTSTNLVNAGMNMHGRSVNGTIGIAVTRLLGQSPEEGALPEIRAAVDDTIPGGAYVGPRGWFELNGAPAVVRPPGPAQDRELAAGLWSLSESTTGVSFA
jgi:NAD(P)-dependent dehydrogenase (short-subunit alcohol dehydrogenase family)